MQVHALCLLCPLRPLCPLRLQCPLFLQCTLCPLRLQCPLFLQCTLCTLCWLFLLCPVCPKSAYPLCLLSTLSSLCTLPAATLEGALVSGRRAAEALLEGR